MKIQKESRKQITPGDFESLVVIGRGAFGEVRLVRRKGKPEDPLTGQIFALKSMKKEMMVVKNQVNHVKAERDALAKADDNNRWLTVLHFSFFDESHLYMVMEFLPGGDLMSLLIKEDTFSESVTRFFMAEAAQAISSVHALGYIHRDIKPDNMLLDARGHLKLTDLGLCKKIGDANKEDDPDEILKRMRGQENGGNGDEMAGADIAANNDGAGSKHRQGDDVMAMSIDGIPSTNDSQKPKYESAKARREVSNCLWLCFNADFENGISDTAATSANICRWLIPQLELPIISRLRCWLRKTEHRVILTLKPSIGGHSVLLCLNVWWAIRLFMPVRWLVLMLRRSSPSFRRRSYQCFCHPRRRPCDHMPKNSSLATVFGDAGGNQGAAFT